MERSTQPATTKGTDSRSITSPGRYTRVRQVAWAVGSEPARRDARKAVIRKASTPTGPGSSTSRPSSRAQAAHDRTRLARDAKAGGAHGLESWLGPAPSDPVALELRALRQRFQLRRQVLSRTLSADQVTQRLQSRSRQVVHDRARASTLLAIRCNGRLRFPLCQFDPEGPDGVAPGLAEVLQALHLSALAKAAWLERPHPALDGQAPIERLKRGELAGVLAAAQRAGRGQD